MKMQLIKFAGKSFFRLAILVIVARLRGRVADWAVGLGEGLAAFDKAECK